MVADDLTMHRAVRKHATDIVILKYYGLSPKEWIEKQLIHIMIFCDLEHNWMHYCSGSINGFLQHDFRI